MAEPFRYGEQLPDGSSAMVETTDGVMSIVSRMVGAETVWGQVFTMETEDEHTEQVKGVLASMRANPGGFTRRDLWDRNGKAVTA